MTDKLKKTTKAAAKKAAPKKYNKEATKQKLIDAIGKILQTKGFAGITIQSIEDHAKADKKLVYSYFGGVKGLVEAYLAQQEAANTAFYKELLSTEKQAKLDKEQLAAVLKSDFERLEQSAEAQQVVLWGISQEDKALRKISDKKEKELKAFLKTGDAQFVNPNVNFRAVNAILSSALNYMALHSSKNKSTISGIDISSKQGKQEIFTAIAYLLDETFTRGKKKK